MSLTPIAKTPLAATANPRCDCATDAQPTVKAEAPTAAPSAPTPPLHKLAMNATSGALITFGSIVLLGTPEITGIVGGLITFAALQAFTK